MQPHWTRYQSGVNTNNHPTRTARVDFAGHRTHSTGSSRGPSPRSVGRAHTHNKEVQEVPRGGQGELHSGGRAASSPHLQAHTPCAAGVTGPITEHTKDPHTKPLVAANPHPHTHCTCACTNTNIFRIPPARCRSRMILCFCLSTQQRSQNHRRGSRAPPTHASWTTTPHPATEPPHTSRGGPPPAGHAHREHRWPGRTVGWRARARDGPGTAPEPPPPPPPALPPPPPVELAGSEGGGGGAGRCPLPRPEEGIFLPMVLHDSCYHGHRQYGGTEGAGAR